MKNTHGKKLFFCTFLMLSLCSCRKKAPPGNYDLMCRSITYSPSTIRVGTAVSFSYTIDNAGKSTIPAGTYDTELYIDGKKVSFDHGSTLLPPGLGSKRTRAPGYYDYKAYKTGWIIYRLVLDPEDRLKETDETNNIIIGRFQVLPPIPNMFNSANK